MRKQIVIFLISLIFGFSILVFRNFYESKSGESKSHWNISELREGDSKNFFDRGLAISQGRQYFSGCESAPIVAFFRPPVYPIFLALTFLAFGISFKAVLILQIIIASLIVVMIFLIANLIFDKTIGWISAILSILYYPMWNNAMIINSELLSMLLGLLALYFILKYFYSDDKSIKLLLYSGVLVGISALTRGQFFFYSFLFVIFIFVSNSKSKKENLKHSAVWFAFCLIPIILWSLYAYISSGVIIFISSQSALSVWWGWSPLVVLEQHYPVWNPLWDKSFIQNDMIGTYLPVKSSFWFLNESFNFILKYPADSVKIAYFKFLDSWGFIDLYSGNSIISKFVKILKFNWDLFLAIPAWIYLWRQKEKKVFSIYTISACILFTFVSIMTAGLIRYRIPYLDPLLIILASVTVYKIYSFFILKKSNLQ